MSASESPFPVAIRVRRLNAALRECETPMLTVGSSRDAAEGIGAFLEKRAPAWGHR